MKSTVLFSALVVTLALGAVATAAETSGDETASSLDGAALIVIDIQTFYFPDGFVPLTGPEEAAVQAAKVIETFRGAERPVIHIQHLPKDVDTPDPTGIQPQYRIHPKVLPIPGEIVIGKHHANSFRDTELLETLRKLQIDKVVIVGMQTHMCVEAAVRAAADFGFDVTVVHDACATRDLEFDGTTVPAGQVHAGALAAMNGSYAKVISTNEFCEVNP
jgi:nicotinamidase-related amidase